MRVQRLWQVAPIALLVVTFAVGGCSKREAAATAAKPETSAAAGSAQQAAARTACALVTAAEMSAIVGTAVSAEGENGGGTTTCRYRPAERSMPYVELAIDWGGGSAGMVGFGIFGRLEPGAVERFAGLGDEASAIGPALMVRTGDDLVRLTFLGVDDNVAAAKKIINQMRPRMGPSAQPKAAGAGGAEDAARAGQVVSGLLNRLAEQKNQKDAKAGADAPSTSGASAALVDDAAYGPFTGPATRVPLVAGLTLVGAEHEAGRGDYEPIVRVAGVTDDMVSTVFSANLPEGTRLAVDRAVRRDDLRQARTLRSWYEDGHPLVFPGTTAFSVSAAVFNDLRAKGQSEFVLMDSGPNGLAAIASLISGNADTTGHQGTLTRVEPHAVAFPVLLNEQPAQLPAIHARGTFNNETIDVHVLDDPDNPLVLRIAGSSVGRIVRIAFPAPAAPPIEEKLKKESRVALHGIYFDFGKATIRPESEPVLRDIAAALAHNPDWTITIEGHTDNIGGDAMNLDLSRRRAEAVKQALVGRYRVPAAGLTTSAFGASRPADSNDTLSGRARNRRVELVRH